MKARPSDCDSVLSALRERPYERKELRAHLGLRDNAMRAAIEQLRADGLPVVWDRATEQYRMARTYDELLAWIEREAEPRARRIETQIRRMKERAIEFFPPTQMTLEAA